MTFVVDALGGWLVGEVASALTRRVGEHLLGSEQERALHVVGHTAIRNTAAQLAPTNPDHFIMVVSEVFVVEVPADQASPWTCSPRHLSGRCCSRSACRQCVAGHWNR